MRHLVPKVGLEPTRCRHHRILSPARLPIPPLRHMCKNHYIRGRRKLQELFQKNYLATDWCFCLSVCTTRSMRRADIPPATPSSREASSETNAFCQTGTPKEASHRENPSSQSQKAAIAPAVTEAAGCQRQCANPAINGAATRQSVVNQRTSAEKSNGSSHHSRLKSSHSRRGKSPTRTAAGSISRRISRRKKRIANGGGAKCSLVLSRKQGLGTAVTAFKGLCGAFYAGSFADMPICSFGYPRAVFSCGGAFPPRFWLPYKLWRRWARR